jgi:hypothetical protein
MSNHNHVVKMNVISISSETISGSVSYPFFLCDDDISTIRMSFGFSIGDFLTAIELANRIRFRFVDIPDQFTAISNE